MMEYRFKGKRKDNGDWVHGYYLIVDNKHLIFPPNAHFDQIGYYSKKGCFGEILQEGTCWICEVDRKSVGQFTGVKERYPQMVGEGQEIYFGDMVRLFGGEYCQGYYEHNQTIVVKSAYDIVAMEESENIQLLGNVWDNPELLKEVE